ncbi:bacterial Ig-like domain family protein [[Clostridium] sordellii ATCC 9714]|nr:bacterial Ig-like domain family protein [[Clostridium] sordellii ATCC 9714] [Paeniclostridium sordellii ATCC 9714]
MAGVTATDKEDGNITKDIKVIENTVDVNKPGKYEVIYQVTDSKGATVTKGITITVISNNLDKNTDNSTLEENANNKGESNTVEINKDKNSQQNKASITSNGNSNNPQTGDTGAIGYLGLFVAALAGLFINKKINKTFFYYSRFRSTKLYTILLIKISY